MPDSPENEHIALMFKTYDVRGIVPDDFTPMTAYLIGRGIVLTLGAEEIIVGRDMRTSSPEIAGALIEGIIDQGANVVDAGMVSSDALYFAIGNYDYRAGAMVTASHNPPEYNGVKLAREGARAVSIDDGWAQIRDLVLANDFPAPEHGLGHVTQREIIEPYAEYVLSFVDIPKVKPLKIAVDAGNGMAGKTIPVVFRDLPCEIVPLYFELDGTFPNHPANPLDPANMVDLQKAVVEEGCDFGVAFDGDADRMFLVDEKGALIGGDITTAMVALALLEKNPGATITYNLISSRSVPEAIEAAGGRAVRTPVGHSLIKKMMREEDAIFGGEHSGHYYFRDNWYADSGLMAMMAVIELLSAKGIPLSEVVAPLENRFRSGEINMKVDDKATRIEAVKEHFAAQGAEIDEFDGVTVNFPDRWLNIRGSNTEPLLRLNVEGDTPEAMAALRDEAMQVIGAA